MAQFETHLADFLIMLRLEEGLSDHTVSAYKSDIQKFLACHEEGEIGGDQIRAYVRFLSQQGYAGASIQRKVAAIKRFVTFLYQEGKGSQACAPHVAIPPVQRSLPVGLSEDLVMSLLQQPTQTDRYAARDAMLLMVMYAAGLRVSELCALTPSSLQLASPASIRVLGKGGKERVVPLPRVVADALSRYLNTQKMGGHAPLFVSRSGKVLSRQAIFQIVRKYASRVGAPEAHPHQLRHAFATHLLNKDVGVRDVQICLGHARLSTTQRYLSVSTDRLKRIYQASHPMNDHEKRT